MTDIPFVDLRAQYGAIRNEIDSAIRRVMDTTAFIGGESVSRFERAFAQFCGAAHCVGVGNGTDALYLALRALGVKPGDEVVTVSHTFIATVEAISLTGARPVLIDVDPHTYLMSPTALEAAITPRTRAIVPVHLYGQPAEMGPIREIARQHQIHVVEDAAQAHGARDGRERAGTLGDVACFSFYPGKNLGAYGDAGAVVTGDDVLAAQVRKLANHGRQEKYVHEIEGVNSRLDGLQAAVLDVKLRHLEAWTRQRRETARAYMNALADVPGVVPPVVRDGADPVWHLFVVQVPDRDGLALHLKKSGIASGIHYPVPVHLQPAYRARRLSSGDLPVTERLCERILSLPMFPELGPAGAERVASAVTEFARKSNW